VGLALCALGNICSAEMARDLSPEVERLMRSREVNTKKKVFFFLYIVIQSSPVEHGENNQLIAVSLMCHFKEFEQS
jgi:AP-1 complex subunit gamma-1